MPPPANPPRRPIDQVVSKFHNEKDIGHCAVQLAQYCFFGTRMMVSNTAGTLDRVKMERIKEIIVAKFGGKRSIVDQEETWQKCIEQNVNSCEK